MTPTLPQGSVGRRRRDQYHLATKDYPYIYDIIYKAR